MIYENPRVKVIQRQAIRKSNQAENKYNFAIHNETEVLTGEPNDRTDYDIGMEPNDEKEGGNARF